MTASAVAVATGILMCTGCESGTSDPPAEGPTPTATLGFTQLIPLEGTRNALLRITNSSDSAIDVTSVAIEWPGYPHFIPSPESATIAADQTLDMRLMLPEPACEEPPADEAVVGVVETEQGIIRSPLQPSGTTYVRRLWQTQCDELAVSNAVAISYSRSWRVVGDGVEARALGDVVLRRRDGDEPIEIEDVDGSVLHGLRLPGPTTLAPGEDVGPDPARDHPGQPLRRARPRPGHRTLRLPDAPRHRRPPRHPVPDRGAAPGDERRHRSAGRGVPGRAR